MNLSPGSRFADYADYFAAFEQAWDGSPGHNIRDITRNAAAEREPRFQRRVLDVYLMLRGGRWKSGKHAKRACRLVCQLYK